MLLSNSFFPITAISAISTICWYGIYKKFRKSYKWGEEFTSRVVAAIHAVIVVSLAFLIFLVGSNPFYNTGEDNTDLQIITMLVSIGYFVYDFGWCLKHQPEPRIMLYHHLASIFAIYYILLHGSSGPEAVCGLGLLEVTNPLLQIRWFLRNLGYVDTLLYKVVEVAFFILFLIVRLGYGSWLLFSVVGSQKSALPVKLCTILLYLISLAFIYSIGRFVVRKLVRGGKDSDYPDDDDVKLS